MKTTRKILMIGLLIALSCASVYAGEYEDTKKMFVDAGIANMFDSAYGYALFPTIGKAGFLVGGAYGKGRVYKQGKQIGNTTMTQATVGFQLGGTGFSQVVFFQDKRALEEFINGTFEFGALIVSCPPILSSAKSTKAPSKKGMLRSSNQPVKPVYSTFRSASCSSPGLQ